MASNLNVYRQQAMLQGSGFKDWLKSAHDYTKKNKLISRSANALGFNTVGSIANMLGYGDPLLLQKMEQQLKPMKKGKGKTKSKKK